MRMCSSGLTGVPCSPASACPACSARQATRKVTCARWSACSRRCSITRRRQQGRSARRSPPAAPARRGWPPCWPGRHRRHPFNWTPPVPRQRRCRHAAATAGRACPGWGASARACSPPARGSSCSAGWWVGPALRARTRKAPPRPAPARPRARCRRRWIGGRSWRSWIWRARRCSSGPGSWISLASTSRGVRRTGTTRRPWRRFAPMGCTRSGFGWCWKACGWNRLLPGAPPCASPIDGLATTCVTAAESW